MNRQIPFRSVRVEQTFSVTVKEVRDVMINIPGDRITLRDWTLDDIPVWKYWLQPQHDWYQTDGPYYGLPSPTEIKEKVDALKQNIVSNNFSMPRKDLVISPRSSGQLIGRVSWYWQDKAAGWPSLGISIWQRN